MHLRNHVQHLLDRISRLKQLRAFIARSPRWTQEDYGDRMLDLEDIDRDLHMCKLELNSTYSARITPSEYRMAELAKDAHLRGLRLHDFILRGKPLNNLPMTEETAKSMAGAVGVVASEVDQLKQNLIDLLNKFTEMSRDLEAKDELNKDKTVDNDSLVNISGELSEAWPFPRQAMPELAVPDSLEERSQGKVEPKQPQTVTTTCLKSNLPPPAALPAIPPSSRLVR